MTTIRWGLIGCGDVARKRVAQAIKNEPRSRLVAACRRNQARLNEFCDTFDIERRYAEADELINDQEIDAVYIATPVKEHLPQTLAAAKAGKHVLVEKPMAMTVSECDQMIAACKDAGVKLSVAYYRRFYPLVHRIEELLNQGAIGKPLAVAAVTSTPLDMQPGDEGYWRVIPEAGGGGALMDVGSHRINVFLHLFGEVAIVRALCENVAATYDSDDSALLLLKFQRGMVGTLQCHFGAPTDPDEFVVTGTKGRLIVRPLNGETLIIEDAAGQQTETHPPAANLCDPLVADFVSAILEDRPPTVSGEEGRATNEIMQRAYLDARTSQV